MGARAQTPEPVIASRVEGRREAGGHLPVCGRPRAPRRVRQDDFDLSLNFFVLAVDGVLRDREIEGVVESAVGFRSILVSYDPLVIAAGEFVDAPAAIYLELPAARGIVISSRS